jgi:low temperature requirement protein LtrA
MTPPDLPPSSADAGPAPETGAAATRRLAAELRHGETVTPLELFFDVVFVLAITECTAYMADHPTWAGIAQGLLILGVLWWGWVGYAWLTSVVDPEEGIVRLAIFASMASILIVSLAIPEAFGDYGLLFAGAYAIFRAGHIALFTIASRDDPALRSSVGGLAVSSAVGVGLLIVAAFTDGALQGLLWLLAISIDVAGPYLFGSEGWKLVPGHFAERHRLIIIIALGESIVAIGAGVEGSLGAGEVTAAAIGVAVAAAIWWLYFDVVSLVNEQRLAQAPPGRERNELARDGYSYLHFPMVAGIILIALGMKKTLGHVGDPLEIEVAAALGGGAALYLLAHVGLRLRNAHTLNRQRLTLAVLFVAAIPLIAAIPALVSLIGMAVAFALLITYETRRYGSRRYELRHTMREPAGG